MLGLACFGLALVILIVKLTWGPSTGLGEERLSNAVAVAGILGAIATLVSTALQVRELGRGKSDRSALLSPHLLVDDHLVDRTMEMTTLVRELEGNRVVNCHGQRGSGKSFLLAHLTDVINGHRPHGPNHATSKVVSAALYFDLADAVGFEQAREQVCQEVLGTERGSWGGFVTRVDEVFARRRVLLILDNVNAPGLWRSVGEAAYQYLARRPNDKIVLGSIEQVQLDNLKVAHVTVAGLNLEATRELIATKGIVIDNDKVVELHRECQGLPIYIPLLTRNSTVAGPSAVLASLDEKVIPSELLPEGRRMLAYVSLFALVTREVSMGDLKSCPLAQLEAQVEAATQLSLLTVIPRNQRRIVKIHDVVRDAALRRFTDEVAEAARVLFERSQRQGRLVEAALYAMFTDPVEVGPANFDSVLTPVIQSAVSSRNYALLSHLHLRANDNTRVLRFLAEERDRYDLFCFARASELAGLGQYSEADDALQASSISRVRLNHSTSVSGLHADMRFLQGDLAHLQNHYDEAVRIFADLGAWASSAGREELEARCLWGQAHALRHQGRELGRALELFHRAADLAETCDALFVTVSAVTGATGLKVFTGDASDADWDRLCELEAKVASVVVHNGYMLKIWKYKAQLAWFRKDPSAAFEILEGAITKALATNDRVLYNLYFERAEFCRSTGDFKRALFDYGEVLTFGNGNGDRNLIANALLGLVLVDVAAGDWLHHRSSIEARASALYARELAREADIQATVQTATQVSILIEGFPSPPPPLRLIVF